jgi:hypothetical protein
MSSILPFWGAGFGGLGHVLALLIDMDRITCLVCICCLCPEIVLNSLNVGGSKCFLAGTYVTNDHTPFVTAEVKKSHVNGVGLGKVDPTE